MHDCLHDCLCMIVYLLPGISRDPVYYRIQFTIPTSMPFTTRPMRGATRPSATAVACAPPPKSCASFRLATPVLPGPAATALCQARAANGGASSCGRLARGALDGLCCCSYTVRGDLSCSQAILHILGHYASRRARGGCSRYENSCRNARTSLVAISADSPSSTDCT